MDNILYEMLTYSLCEVYDLLLSGINGEEDRTLLLNWTQLNGGQTDSKHITIHPLLSISMDLRNLS